MEQNETDEPTKILINDKEIDKDEKLSKIKSCIRNFFNNLFSKNSPSDSFPYKNKALENTFWCSQTIYIRIILLSCFFSFVVSWNQNIALIGDNGLTPAKDHVNKILEDLKNESIWTKIQNFHSLFLFLPVCNFTINLLPIIVLIILKLFPFSMFKSLGIILSLTGLFLNYINLIIILSIYILLQSIYSIGNIWFNYVYELELLELVFLCLFLVPLYKNHLKKKYSTTCLIRYIARFFVFKVLIGSSLIRLRNTDLWGRLEGKYYIYETQPLPSSLSYFLHSSILLSKLDNLFSILTECIFSFFILFPIRSFRLVGGCIIFIYCLLNFFSGNSYLFYFLLLAPLMFCFDDNILLKFFFKWRRNEILNVVKEKIINQNKSKRYFKSFDIFYFTGMSSEELSKIYDTYFNSNKERNTLTQEEELISRSGSNEITFYKNESILKNIKNDIYNIFYWIYSKNGLQYFIRNKNLSFEIISHIICSIIIIIYICIATIYPMTTFHFIFYLLIFNLYAVYIFAYTNNIISKIISQMTLLISILLIYSNKIFLYGFVDIFYSSLFFINLVCLFILSFFFLNNRRFIFKFTAQYFYFILFIYFLSFFIRNSLSPYQVMNAEYGSFELMNVYGSFGKIKKARKEIIIQGTESKNINDNTVWKNYEFNCKPDNVFKNMCNQFRLLFHFIPIIYIDRLDWQLSVLSDKEDETILEIQWFKKFLTKLSLKDENIISLLYKNPFMSNNIKAPYYLRILNNVYKFSENDEKQWWDIVSSKVIVKPHHIPVVTEDFTTNKEMDHKNFMLSNSIQQISKHHNHRLRKHIKNSQNIYEREKKLKEQNKVEQQRKMEEQNKIEQQKKKLEKELKKIEEQKKKLEEQQKKLDEERKKLDEEGKKLEQQRKVEEYKISEEKKRLEKEIEYVKEKELEEQRTIDEEKKKLERQIKHVEEKKHEEQRIIDEEKKKLERQIKHVEEKKHEEQRIIDEEKKKLEKEIEYVKEKELEEQRIIDQEKKRLERQKKIEQQNIYEQREIEEKKKKLEELKKVQEHKIKLEEQKLIEEKKRIKEEKEKLEQQNIQKKNENKSNEELDERLKSELLSENQKNMSTIHKLNNSNNLQHIKMHGESPSTKGELNESIDEELNNELYENPKKHESSEELNEVDNDMKNDEEIIEPEEESNEEIEEKQEESNEQIEEEKKKKSSEEIKEEEQQESSDEIEKKKNEKLSEQVDEDEKLENELNEQIEEKENEELINDEIKQKEELEKESYEDIEENEEENGSDKQLRKEKIEDLLNEEKRQKLQDEFNIKKEGVEVENIDKKGKNSFDKSKNKNIKKDEELERSKSNVASYEFKKFFQNGNTKNELDNAIKNSYTKYKLLNNYSNKINKLGLFNIYNDRNKFAGISKLKENSNNEGNGDVYLKDAIHDNDNNKKNLA